MITAALRRSWTDPLLRFLILAVLLYAGWYVLYARVIHPWGVIDRAVIDNLVMLAGGILELLGHELIPEPQVDFNRYIGAEGGTLLWIGDPCNGVSLFAVFTLFLMAYPGPLRHKAWFLPFGLITIHLLNALRIAALCIITTIDYELLSFNHDYTFYLIVYGWVFALWYWWVKRFAPRQQARPMP